MERLMNISPKFTLLIFKFLHYRGRSPFFFVCNRLAAWLEKAVPGCAVLALESCQLSSCMPYCPGILQRGGDSAFTIPAISNGKMSSRHLDVVIDLREIQEKPLFKRTEFFSQINRMAERKDFALIGVGLSKISRQVCRTLYILIVSHRYKLNNTRQNLIDKRFTGLVLFHYFE